MAYEWRYGFCRLEMSLAESGKLRARATPRKKQKAKRTPRQRGKGRPASNATSVGADALVDVACEVLKATPPSDITRVSVAREANVDPGLIRYYFQNRDSLMRMAAQTLTQRLQQRGAAASEREDLSGFDRISERVRALLAFKVENPFYHRLMMEEMALSKDPESRAVFMGIASAAVARYESYLKQGVSEGEIRNVNPALLYIAIIGLCDYFVIAAPALAPLVGEQNPKKLMNIYGDFICDLLLNGLRK